MFYKIYHYFCIIRIRRISNPKSTYKRYNRVNRKSKTIRWVKFIFTTSHALNWALSDAVLGKSENACLRLPRGATLGVFSNDKKISYENLEYIMNHTGTSWWISHQRFPCNSFTVWIHPHLAFYEASNNIFSSRARSDDGVWGAWGGDNEYRYFLR